MKRAEFSALDAWLSLCAGEPAFAPVRAGRDALDTAPRQDAALELYERALPLAERRLWSRPPDPDLLDAYQRLWRELETHRAAAGADRRHAFLVVIPVADRPQQLENCLQSLLQLCRLYAYGGQRNGRFRKVSALIADDSVEALNMDRHRELAAHFDALGLATEYFGRDAQRTLLATLEPALLDRLTPVLGSAQTPDDQHRGASVTRNLVSLYLHRRARPGERRLYQFVDSDQEFKVRVGAAGGGAELFALNYFAGLERIFSQGAAEVVTGKVVGDPPVSPAVMAGNFMDDVGAFLTAMQDCTPRAACAFHADGGPTADDAAYHDMADLFGFKPAAAFPYHCALPGRHDNAACFDGFSRLLDRFFDGGHPTRKTVYAYAEVLESLAPARTVYTGNYVVNAAGLRWFIPFAGLKLRMAGPTLGRIVRAAAGAHFFAANLPMLHRRTLEHTGQAEFRSGIRREPGAVDLSGEFERQFFGDLMLFGVERLTGEGFPANPVSADAVERTLQQVEAELLARYREKRGVYAAKLVSLRARFDAAGWWHREPGLHSARRRFAAFLDDMARNFGPDSHGYAMIESHAHRTRRRQAIAAAILGYRDERAAWESVAETNL